MLALQESASAVLTGVTLGLSDEDPPWNIEGEPRGMRPFEADNKGDAMGHTGYHTRQPCCIQTLLAPPASQITPHHSPWASTCHYNVALKLQVIVLRPIERAHTWNWRRRWQCHTSTNMSCPCHMRDTHDSMPCTPAPSQAMHIK